jgi:hypothetical protein
MKLKATLLKLNEPINMVIYDDEAAKVIIDCYNQRREQTEMPTQLLGEFCPTHQSMNISLKNVSHFTDNLRIEDNTIVGEIKIMETPEGKLLLNLINDLYGKDLYKHIKSIIRENRIDSIFSDIEEEVPLFDITDTFEEIKKIGLYFSPRIIATSVFDEISPEIGPFSFYRQQQVITVKIQKFYTFDIKMKNK